MNGEVLRLENICKSFSGPGGVDVLKDINLTLHKGESISVQGKSGSGKSTLLYIASLIEKPTSGSVFYSGSDVTGFSDSRLSSLRRDKMGFVFQHSLLLEDFSALENAALPLLNRGVKKKDAFEKASVLLAHLGLGERLQHRPAAMSGGERQRTAIARAVITSPDIIFADEPTGSLDEESASMIEDLLFSLVCDNGLSMILVTHNPQFAAKAEHHYMLTHKELMPYVE